MAKRVYILVTNRVYSETCFWELVAKTGARWKYSKRKPKEKYSQLVGVIEDDFNLMLLVKDKSMLFYKFKEANYYSIEIVKGERKVLGGVWSGYEIL